MSEKPFVRGQRWRRIKDGTVVQVTAAFNCSTGSADPFYDIRWRTVGRPIKTGACFENYWLRTYERVDTQ